MSRLVLDVCGGVGGSGSAFVALAAQPVVPGGGLLLLVVLELDRRPALVLESQERRDRRTPRVGPSGRRELRELTVYDVEGLIEEVWNRLRLVA